jgi:hypothetical protein
MLVFEKNEQVSGTQRPSWVPRRRPRHANPGAFCCTMCWAKDERAARTQMPLLNGVCCVEMDSSPTPATKPYCPRVLGCRTKSAGATPPFFFFKRCLSHRQRHWNHSYSRDGTTFMFVMNSDAPPPTPFSNSGVFQKHARFIFLLREFGPKTSTVGKLFRRRIWNTPVFYPYPIYSSL